MHRVGIVSPISASPEPPQVRAFRQELRELGYIEGKNVTFETRFAEGRSERLPELFAELIRLKVDGLVTGSAVGALAAKRAKHVDRILRGTKPADLPELVFNLNAAKAIGLQNPRSLLLRAGRVIE